MLVLPYHLRTCIGRAQTKEHKGDNAHQANERKKFVDGQRRRGRRREQKTRHGEFMLDQSQLFLRRVAFFKVRSSLLPR